MKINFIAPLVLTLGLIGCSSESSAPAKANESAQTTPAAAPVDETAADKPADKQDNATSTDSKSIPAAFQGTWASTPKDCAPGMESQLAITANELQFLESHADITSVKVISPTHIQTFGKFEGEGEQWEGKPEFQLVAGNKLSMTVDGASTGEPRIKCP